MNMTQMAAGVSIIELTRQETAYEHEVAGTVERSRRVSQVCFRIMWLLVPLTVLAFYVFYRAMSPAGALGALTAGMLMAVGTGLRGVAATHRLELID